MNLEVSGLLSLFTGLTGAEKLPETWLENGALPEQFAALLNERMAMLQQPRETLSPPAGRKESLTLQHFAAFPGKALPPGDTEADIDLEATMQALAEVLQTIEASQPVTERTMAVASAASGAGEEHSADLMRRPMAEAVQAAQKSPGLANEIIMEEPLPESLSPVRQDGKQEVQNPPAPTSPTSDPLEVDPKPLQREASGSRGEDKPDPGPEQKPLAGGWGDDRKPVVEPAGPESKSLAVDDVIRLSRVIVHEGKSEIAPMQRHFAHPQWGQEFSERVIWMHKQNIPSAELNLNPRHLGPISIRVDVNQEQTSIAFATQHLVVKDAIEAALPRLKEMLGAQQLNLVDVDVSQQQSQDKSGGHFFQEGSERQKAYDRERFQSDRQALGVTEEIEVGRAIAGQGILSLFA